MARLCLSRGRDGLVRATHPGLAAVEHDGVFVLHRCHRGEALTEHGCTQIFNTDQGSQFTHAEFTSVLINNGVSISMDGEGAWRDTVLVARFWRTVKYEEVYPHAHEGVGEARQSIARFIAFYGEVRTHLSLQRDAPVRRDVCRTGRVRSCDLAGYTINMFEFGFPTGTSPNRVVCDRI
jgi:hypothetical protein